MSINIQNYPKVYDVTVAANSSFGGSNLTTFPNNCYFLQISNNTNQTIKVRLNGDSAATFSLAGNAVQQFNPGDVVITIIDFQGGTVSGATSNSVE